MKSFWKKQLPSLLMALALMLTLVPTAEAKSKDIVYEVDPGKSVTLKASDFNELLDYTYDLQYIKLHDPSGLDRWGTLEAENSNGRTVYLDESDLGGKGAFFVHNTHKYLDDGDYVLYGTTFTADSRADGETVTLGCKITGEDNDGISQTVETTIEFRIGSSSGGSSSSGKQIAYNMDPGRDLELNRRDFYNYYESDPHTRGSMTYLKFTNYKGLDDYGYFSAVNSSGKIKNLGEAELDNTWFYYGSIETNGDFDLDTLTFTSYSTAKGTMELEFELVDRTGTSGHNTSTGTLAITIGKGSGSSGKVDVPMRVDKYREAEFDPEVFDNVFWEDNHTKGTMTYLVFTNYKDLDDYGYLTSRKKDGSEVSLAEKDLDNMWFYYDKRNISAASDCTLKDLVFHANKNATGSFTMDFEVVGEGKNNSTTGTLEIVIDGSGSSGQYADITYKVDGVVNFDSYDFEKYYDRNCSGTFEYVKFTGSEGLEESNGWIYSRYNTHNETIFTPYELGRSMFGADSYDESTYYISKLSFVPGRNFKGPVTLDFRAYGTNKQYVDGKVILEADGSSKPEQNIPSFTATGVDIFYTGAGNAPVRINADDIARFYAEKVPNGSLQYVRLNGVPSVGGIYYNYDGKTSFGSGQMLLTPYNCTAQYFSYYPSAPVDYALSALTYLPSGSNYCATIPFTAFGTGGNVSGNIYISVTLKKAVPEVYGPTPKGTSVPFPVKPVYDAVYAATGSKLAGIRLLGLPAASEGVVKMTSGGVSLGVTLESTFGYNSGSWLMNQIRFDPAPNFTGNVEIPYAAYDTTGTVFAAGKVSIGVVDKKVSFKDVNSSTWCYKYVTELSSAGIISGYKDGTFKEKNSLTWGAALKLICLANGVGKSNDTFDTFLSLARSKGWVTGNINLRSKITRVQFCQVAAKAMGLSISNLPQTKPFTDTADVYVQALNAAGIIGGYADGTFKPNNTLTRGHISAIIWRMNEYRK